jgi:predicted GNAT family acetyltransferase
MTTNDNETPHSKLPGFMPTSNLVYIEDKTDYGSGYYALMSAKDENGVEYVLSKMYVYDSPKGDGDRFITRVETPEAFARKGYGREITLRGFVAIEEAKLTPIILCPFAMYMARQDAVINERIMKIAAATLAKMMKITVEEAAQLVANKSPAKQHSTGLH